MFRFKSLMHFNRPIRFFSYRGITMVIVNENERFVKKELNEKYDLFSKWNQMKLI
jgi:hypothetical protein